MENGCNIKIDMDYVKKTYLLDYNLRSKTSIRKHRTRGASKVRVGLTGDEMQVGALVEWREVRGIVLRVGKTYVGIKWHFGLFETKVRAYHYRVSDI